ncbi:MAG: ATP-dependent zinc metalloprotease FtsH, partial [Candidatus Marinimicrobia bacterium]|nr:ATP-dependent zinc metalloprotease FtsH [Candidatus Neomarinimicrobiota bacterium]
VLPFVDSEVTKKWDEQGISYRFKDQTMGLLDYLIQFSPWILLIFFWFYLMRRMQGGGGQNGIFNFGKSRARIISPDSSKVTFDDVAGCDEAKVELQEIVEFLKSPKKFLKLGAKIPKGALLLGPPGTGKTLLARAIAGEADVPYFSISGAEFVEMFVGVGASRVRDLFDQAKKNAPSIIFIDEMDAVGRHRGAGLGGGHDEREQTLNQILVEMDGFETDDNVILLAATNRPDVLDKALLRPGRFDRQIVVDAPGIDGREAIFKIHTRRIPLSDDVDLKTLAKGTPGLVGADLENLANEAALLAARRDKKSVTMSDFEDAKDKVMMGVERKSMILTPEERKVTAYHEAGHSLVAYFTEYSDPVHKISIIPRGRALGITSQLPDNEKHNYSRNYLLARLDVLMGGRTAEKIVIKDLSTGAGNDISVATDIARRMVCEWGLSDRIGPLTFGKKQEEVFLGREISHSRDYSDDISTVIDEEISLFVKDAENRAEKILRDNIEILHNLANALLEYETISGDNMEKIINGKPIQVQPVEEPKKRKRKKIAKKTTNKNSKTKNTVG